MIQPSLNDKDRELLIASIRSLAEQQPLLLRPEQRVLAITATHADILVREAGYDSVQDYTALRVALSDPARRALVLYPSTIVTLQALEQLLAQCGHGIIIYWVSA